MQNDDGSVGMAQDATGEPMDDFQRLLRQLEQMKSKPLFTQEEEEEVSEDDHLFDDEDYEDIETMIHKQKPRDEESSKKLFEDDDYYDDYSDEEQDEKTSSKNHKTSINSSSDSKDVMQDFMKGKTASHRFKSRFDDFASDNDELLSPGSRKLRKNDSIKVISTPNGKVGIVYKVESKNPEDDEAKKSRINQSGTAEIQQKITPVITADGKVALLYRGASDNSETFRNKYEPITNKDILTQLIDNNDKSTTSSSGGNANNSIKNITNMHSIYNSNYDSFNNNNVIIGPASVESDSIDSSVNNRQLVTVTQTDSVPHETTPHSMAITPSTFISTATMTTTTTAPHKDENERLQQERQENTLLINRPLSEVLGIKKNNERPSLGDRGSYTMNGFSRSRFYINRRTTPALPPRVIKDDSEEEWSNADDSSVPEVINLAIIPAFEHEIDEKYIRPYGDDQYHRRNRHHYNSMAPGHPTVHCAMQVVVACAALGTFFGIAGVFFRSRLIDQLEILHW